jgi:anti-anti-sigma factor
VALAKAMEPSADQITVRLHGELDLNTVDDLTNVLHECIAHPECTRVVVDLSEVTFIDCRTIGALVRADGEAADAERGLSVIGATGLVHRVLSITGVLDLLTERSRTDARL